MNKSLTYISCIFITNKEAFEPDVKVISCGTSSKFTMCKVITLPVDNGRIECKYKDIVDP